SHDCAGGDLSPDEGGNEEKPTANRDQGSDSHGEASRDIYLLRLVMRYTVSHATKRKINPACAGICTTRPQWAPEPRPPFLACIPIRQRARWRRPSQGGKGSLPSPG